jgi:hypothetical protein
MYPRVKGALALAKFKYPNSLTTKILDLNSANDSHYATVSGASWCGGNVAPGCHRALRGMGHM